MKIGGDYKEWLCTHPLLDTGYVDPQQEACDWYDDEVKNYE